MGKNRHVVPHSNGWTVRVEGSERVSSVDGTQQAAINKARSSAKLEHSELVIHGRDGRIRDKDSFRPDPNPPKDAEH